ncbi:hypothetical protein [Haliangium sp.]|uniref:hypothetical protein n=1 Tax=Haliangium sp. TaxID=2663208 RepID=UPI003D0E0898
MSTDDDDPPLVSERSPSLARARHEYAHPAPTAAPAMIAALTRLLEAEHDAASLCAVAASLLAAAAPAGDPAGVTGDPAGVIADLAEAHQARCDALARTLAQLGAAAPRPEQYSRVLARDPDDLRYGRSAAELIAAAAATEDELTSFYTRILARDDVPEPVRERLLGHRSEQADHQAQVAALTPAALRL